MYLGAEIENGGVYRSDDGGNCWRKVFNGNINTIAVHPFNPEIVYAGSWNARGFYVTLSGGQDWTALNDGLPIDPGIESMAVDPRDPSHVYIGTTAGVYETTLDFDPSITTASLPAATVGVSYSAKLNALKKQTLLQIYGIVTLTVLIIAAIWITSIAITKKYISRPLLKLQESASLIAQGDLNTFIDKSSRGEIGILAQHLDAMRGSIKQLFGELSESKQKLEEYSRTLEQKVEMRTRELARSVEELKVLAEISRAVSSTLDLKTVLSSIVRHAVQLSKADAGTIYEFDESKQVFVPQINYGVSQDYIEAIREAGLHVGDETVIGESAGVRPIGIARGTKNHPQNPSPR